MHPAFNVVYKPRRFTMLLNGVCLLFKPRKFTVKPDSMLFGIGTLDRKMTSFRQSENIIAL